MMIDEDIVNEIGKYLVVMVIFIGGEFFLWIDDVFIDFLYCVGKYVCIEINGMKFLFVVIDWVICFFKQGVNLVLNWMDEVKVVYEG